MNLRGKIISLFLIGFGLMAVIVFELLHTNLQGSFEEIERKQATAEMAQLAHSLNNELNRLQQLDIDWASWDAMVHFTQHPSHDFVDRQILPGAFQTLQLKFILILDKQNNPIFSDAFNLDTGKEDDPAVLAPVFVNILKRVQSPVPGRPCGLDMSAFGPLLICWQPIHPSHHKDATVGTLVMGQLLDNRILKRIRDQSGITFELNPLNVEVNDNPQITPSLLQKATIALDDMEFLNSETNVLIAHLNNIVGQPILEIRLQFSNDVSQQGRKIILALMRAVLLITFLTSFTLLIGIHFLVIRRLRNMEVELNNIWRSGRWASRLTAKEKQDEIGQLAASINRMLSIIRQQVVVLEQSAHTDGLTLIANRRSFDQQMAIETSLHKRNQTPLSLLMLDVDFFKRYNDTYGHPAGDVVLKELGKILSQIACRPSDLPARIGGEEFAVILPGTDLDGANFVAEKIAAQLAKLQLIHSDSPISKYVTVSIGVTMAGSEEDVATFVARADKAVYIAKQTGRNKISLLPAV